MSSPSSISNTAPGAAEKQASAAQPAKQGRWGWPLRSAVEVSKPSSGPSGAGSGSSALPSSLPVVSGGESLSPAQPDTAVPKPPAMPPIPKPARINSAKLARIPNTEPEHLSGGAKLPRTSISTERPNQPQLPFSRPDSLNFDKSVDAPDSADTQNPPDTKPVPPLIDLKSPKRTWPPVQARTNSHDSTNKEDPPTSSSRKGSGSTTSTRRSSRNLRTWPPVSPLPGDAGDVESNGALSSPSPRRSLGLEDNKSLQETRERATSNQASLPLSPVKSDRFGIEVDDGLGENDYQTARIPEAIQTRHEQAEQEPSSQVPGAFPPRSGGTFTAPVSKEAEGVSGPQRSSTSLSSVSSILETVREGSRDSEEKVPAPTSNPSGVLKANPRTSPYETEQNPWGHESIFQSEDARQIPAEPKLAGGSSLDPGFSERETGPGHSEIQIPGAARNGSDIIEGESEPRAFEHPKNDKKVSFAGLDRDDSSSGTITPSEQVNNIPERSVAEELGPLDSDAAMEAPNGVKEDSPSAISKVDTTLFGTRNPFTNNHLSPLPENGTSREVDSAGSTAAPQKDVSMEDLRSLQGIKSEEPSRASSSADVSLIQGGPPSAAFKKSLSESIPHFYRTDQKGKSPEPSPKRAMSEDEGSFETVQSHPNRDGGVGKLLDLTIGVQAEVRQSGTQRPSNDVPELETVRTVIEIPPSHSTAKRLPIPKITVQNPSDATEPEVPSPPRKGSGLRGNSISAPRSLQSATQRAEGRRSNSLGRPPAFIDTEAAKDQATNGEPKTPPLKKRKLYLRKARDLARQTKPTLKRLAKGEYVAFEETRRY